MEDISALSRLAVKNPMVDLQLYSAATPNGMKVAACLEELCILKSLVGVPFDYEGKFNCSKIILLSKQLHDVNCFLMFFSTHRRFASC